MLVDHLKSECWNAVTDGVKMCKLSSNCLTEGLYPLQPDCRTYPHYLLFFCCGGSFILRRRSHPAMEVNQQEIFLCSASSDALSIQASDALMGYCVSIDPEAAQSSFQPIYSIFGHLDLSTGSMAKVLDQHSGCINVHNTCWNQAVFSVLSSLPYQEQGPYCVFKIAELFYLLCAHSNLLENIPDQLPALGYPVNIIRRVHDYMETHLDEKLTIPVLSRQFQISATALKNGFRALYGQPLHTWLQNSRIQRAAELLQFSDKNVLEIAQSVGYEGVSQFNVVFKRIYGVSPSHYRKMSEARMI